MALEERFSRDQDPSVSETTSEQPSGSGESPLMKQKGEDMETHGPHWAFTAFEIDLDRYVEDFSEQVVAPYEEGKGTILPADAGIARSLVPPGTGRFRDFSHLSPELPAFIPDNCVACMECVTLCPDTAILAKIAEQPEVEAVAEAIDQLEDSEDDAAEFSRQWTQTTKFHGLFEKKGEAGGLFAIYVDPTKCKGCGECVEVCGSHQALEMVPKTDPLVGQYRSRVDHMKSLPESPERFLTKQLAVDIMLKEERTLLYVGGAGSCAGCGEATAVRMLLAVTGNEYETEDIGIVAATGCNTVYGSTYPYNPFRVTWTNSLFENAPTVAMGVRERWNQMGWERKRLWVLGGDGAMYDIGFQALSRMLVSGMDIKVMVLDTQVYSNTGGQTSTASFPGQAAKMSPHGKVQPGKVERRKEISQIAMMHPDVYVAQTSPVFINHFTQAVREANSYPGPAVINVYTPCQPEHGIADDLSGLQSRRAVNGRAFPLLIFDPRKGKMIRERLSLRVNPAMTDDWMKPPKEEEPFRFVDFARTEGRFAKQFDAQGQPSEALLAAQQDRLDNWRQLQELGGIGRKE
jgi:pyruvate/2-oxoacid:ferredoxin oxidoreductase beta subunit/NAD-dependent dihydropyrimidine dehydrogenase PreA subunit